MLDDYLSQKRQELGLERYETLQKVQNWLDRNYPGQARAISLNRGVLRILSDSASVATDLRFKQAELFKLAGEELVRLQVSIGKR